MVIFVFLLFLFPLATIHSALALNLNSVQDLSSTSGLVNDSLSRTATSDSGISTVVWSEQLSGSLSIIQSSAYRDGAWTGLSDIDSSQILRLPYVGSDALGNAVVVWQVGGINRIRASTVDFNSTNWRASATLSTNGSEQIAKVVTTPSGASFAAWVSSPRLQSSTLTDFSTNTWGVAEEILSSSTTSRPYQIYWNLTTPFIIFPIPTTSLRVSRHDPTWTAFPNFSSSNSPTQGSLGFDSLGGSIALYQEASGTNPHPIKYATLAPGASSWSSALTLTTTPSGPGPTPRIAEDPNGNAVAAWMQVDGSIQRIFASVFSAGTATWSTPVAISSPDASVVSSGTTDEPFLNIAMDSSGDAVVVWADSTDGGTTIIAEAALLPFGKTDWVLYSLSSSTAGSQVRNPQVSVSPDGNVVISWVFSSDGFTTSYVQSLTGEIGLAPVAPPSSISGRKEENRFLFQSEYFDIINWSSSTSSGIVAFRIYRNGSRIATVGSDVFSYQEQLRSKNSGDTYGVTAVIEDGTESPPAEVFIQ